jgi:hypothetical protein
MGVWEYGSVKKIILKKPLTTLQLITVFVFLKQIFTPILPYSHTPILVSYFLGNFSSRCAAS